MSWCPHCAKNSDTHRDHTTGSVCCVDCGKVISHELYTEEATFVKDASGATRLSGNMVKMGSACSESHKRTLEKGDVVIDALIQTYGMENVNHATKYYEIAVERGFTRGRRTNQVAAACLYVACRELEKPFLLIELSSELGVSVYELGTVYLQLCKLLSLQDHPFVQKPVDPSLFIHRYIRGLMGDNNNSKPISNTALHLLVSMKRDWIQTGRKPSGICAAAIYVASVLHGYKFSKSDVVKAVHICEATLTKRLIEFENTKAGSLTIEEFTENAKEFEKERESCKQSANDLKMPGMTEVVCDHKSNQVQSGFGLCKNCYMEFCGGLDGSEPPAFQQAELERLSQESVKSLTNSASGVDPCPKTTYIENGTQRKSEPTVNEKEGSLTEVPCTSPNSGKVDKTSYSVDPVDDTDPVYDNEKVEVVDETDTLSDIDDSEVSFYLNNKEESHFKKIIWEKLNKEYMQEQAAKEAAAEAARKLYTGTSEEIREAQALAAATAAAVASKRQKDREKRKLEARNAKPAETAAEAAGQHFTKKNLSSKINYDAFNSLFGDEDLQPSSKKNRVDDGDQVAKEPKETNDVEDNDDEIEGPELYFDNEEQIHSYVDQYDGYFEEY